MPPWEFHPGNYSQTQGTQVCGYLEDMRHGSKFKIHLHTKKVANLIRAEAKVDGWRLVQGRDPPKKTKNKKTNKLKSRVNKSNVNTKQLLYHLTS